MKRTQKFLSGFALLTTLGAALGCSVPVFTDPVTLTTRHFESFREQAESAPVVSGKSCSRLTLLVIPLGVGTANAAFNDALGKAEGADTLVDWHMKQDVLAIVGTLIYFQSCITVEGKAVKSDDLVASAQDSAAAERYVQHWKQQQELGESAAHRQAMELAQKSGGTASLEPVASF